MLLVEHTSVRRKQHGKSIFGKDLRMCTSLDALCHGCCGEVDCIAHCTLLPLAIVRHKFRELPRRSSHGFTYSVRSRNTGLVGLLSVVKCGESVQTIATSYQSPKLVQSPLITPRRPRAVLKSPSTAQFQQKVQSPSAQRNIAYGKLAVRRARTKRTPNKARQVSQHAAISHPHRHPVCA